MKIFSKMGMVMSLALWLVCSSVYALNPVGKTHSWKRCPNGITLHTSIECPTTRKILFDFEDQMAAWTYTAAVGGDGAPGYELTGTDPNIGDSTSTARISATRSFDKADYGSGTVLSFDATDVPGGGGSYSGKYLSNLTDKQANWWVFYDNYELSTRGITNADTDRMSFYIKLDGMQPSVGPHIGTTDPVGNLTTVNRGGSNNRFHVGTYICASVPGGCPVEGPSNNHYYHYLGLNSGAWIHAQLDEKPQHLRGPVEEVPTNPAKALYGYDGYYANMHQMYFEIREAQAQQTTMWLDEIAYHSTDDTDPNQNQQSISSLWVGYWEADDEWQISWTDENQEGGNGQLSTYEIRYSTQPITNANWGGATPVLPKFYTGPQYESNPSDFAIRKMDDWFGVLWTAFDLPNGVETSGSTVYFAIKDISVIGTGGGSLGIWSANDPVTAPNDFVRTTTYIMQ